MGSPGAPLLANPPASSQALCVGFPGHPKVRAASLAGVSGRLGGHNVEEQPRRVRQGIIPSARGPIRQARRPGQARQPTCGLYLHPHDVWRLEGPPVWYQRCRGLKYAPNIGGRSARRLAYGVSWAPFTASISCALIRTRSIVLAFSTLAVALEQHRNVEQSRD